MDNCGGISRSGFYMWSFVLSFQVPSMPFPFFPVFWGGLKAAAKTEISYFLRAWRRTAFVKEELHL